MLLLLLMPLVKELSINLVLQELKLFVQLLDMLILQIFKMLLVLILSLLFFHPLICGLDKLLLNLLGVLLPLSVLMPFVKLLDLMVNHQDLFLPVLLLTKKLLLLGVLTKLPLISQF